MKKDNCWSEQSREKSTVSTVPFFFWGGGGATRYSALLVWDTTQSALQYIIFPGHWIQYQSCTHSVPSQLPGSILARRTCHIKRQITFASYRVPIYTSGWRAAMWIKCLAEGKKYQALTGIEPATHWSRVKGSIQYTTALSYTTRAPGGLTLTWIDVSYLWCT